MRYEQTKQLYLRLTSTLVLRRKQEMLYMPLNFENNRTKDALVETAAYVSAIVQNDVDTTKEKGPNNILESHNLTIFQTQVANNQLEKP